MALSCVLVDDEPLALERLSVLLAEAAPDVVIAGRAGGGEEAVALIGRVRPEVIFLDVQMPVLDGFDVVDLLPHPRPHIVFVTAHDEFALRAFEVHAVDYLTKPVRIERLRATIDRLRALSPADGDRRIEAMRAAAPLRRITVGPVGRTRIVPVQSVRMFESDSKLVYARVGDQRWSIDLTLDDLDRRLDSARFFRVHRSAIVNLAAVRELRSSFGARYFLKLDDGSELPVARRRLREVRRRLREL